MFTQRLFVEKLASTSYINRRSYNCYTRRSSGGLLTKEIRCDLGNHRPKRFVWSKSIVKFLSFIIFPMFLSETKHFTIFTEPFKNMRTLKSIQSSTDSCFSLPSIKCSAASLPASNYCRARGIEIVEHSSDNGTGNSRKLGGAAEHLIDSSEKRLCRLSFEFYSPHVYW